MYKKGEAGLLEQRYFVDANIGHDEKKLNIALLNEAVFIFFYIYCNFGQIFCTEVIQLFSVANMGH